MTYTSIPTVTDSLTMAFNPFLSQDGDSP
jgi:hypothetical protein